MHSDTTHIGWRRDQQQLAYLFHAQSVFGEYEFLMHRSRLASLQKQTPRLGLELRAVKQFVSVPAIKLHTPRNPDEFPVPAGMEPCLGLLAQFHRLRSSGGAASGDALAIGKELQIPPQHLDQLEVYFLFKCGRSGQDYLFYLHTCKAELQLLQSNPAEPLTRYMPPYASEEWHEDSRAWTGVVLCTANLQRAGMLFGDRGYRVCFLEAGRMTEQLRLCAEQSDGVTATHVAVFYDRAIHSLLGIDGVTEVCTSSLILTASR
ncbi:hypothetical protein ACFFK0_26195 [Paenibacillus chartarius]|uniref:Uncharacterized protein n=1 Tax=Paenibacillus chartarius TaxID=747481 RepID=A0ABV6DTB3_9BACL